MNVTSPFVSVIITSFNYEAYVSRALQSAMDQKADGMEIVVVDNASDDDSWAIIQENAKRDPRVRTFRNEHNVGMIGNHILGLELARGERVLFLSADDFLLPGHVSRLVAAHREHPEIDYIFTSYVKVDENDRLIRFFGHPGHLRGAYYGGRNEFAGLLTYDCYMCFPTTLFLRAELLRHGGFRADVTAGDLDTYLRLATEGARFAFLDTAGVAVRLHALEASGEGTYVATGRQLLDHIFLLEQYLRDDNRALFTGHERAIARLLEAKINNVRSYPETAATLLPQLQPQIEQIVSRLNGSHAGALTKAAGPSISVILSCGSDIVRALAAIETVAQQNYPCLELVLISQDAQSLSPLLLDRARSLKTNVLYSTRPTGSAAAYNDGLQLTGGDIITYLTPEVRWPKGHLDRIAAAFAKERIDLLITSVDLVVEKPGKTPGDTIEVARFSGFAGSPIAQTSAHIGEGIPLESVSHRRLTLDSLGHFNEQLPALAEIDFVHRLLAGSRVALDDSSPIELHRFPNDAHPAFTDPSAYLTVLRAMYESRPADATLAATRQAHLTKTHAELSRIAQLPNPGSPLDFAFTARGPVPKAERPSNGRPRILVIDDRVPYDELGRGYPRARKLLDDLRDGGYEVTFYPLLEPWDASPLDGGVDGVEILYGRGHELLAATLHELLPRVDVLWVSRPHNMSEVRGLIGTAPQTRNWALIYDAEAVYVEREAIEGQLNGKPLDSAEYTKRLDAELSLTDGCDAVIAVSSAERDIIARRFAGPIEILPFSIVANPSSRPFEERSGLLFVGAIEAASPNEDALLWFADNVAAQAKALLGARTLHAGVLASPKLLARSNTIEFLGMLPSLREAYESSRIFIAPTRYAAGLPQKVYEAAASGLPVIGTSLIAEQLGWEDGRDMSVADSASEWLEALTRLYRDASLWKRLQDAALARVRREVDPNVFSARALGLLRSVRADRAASGASIA